MLSRFLPALLLLACTTATAQRHFTVLEKPFSYYSLTSQELHGPVKSFRSKTFTYHDGIRDTIHESPGPMIEPADPDSGKFTLQETLSVSYTRNGFVAGFRYNSSYGEPGGERFSFRNGLVASTREVGADPSSSRFTYDPNGRLLQYDIYRNNREKIPFESTVYTYDEQGRISSLQRYRQGAAGYRTTYVYNDAGQLIRRNGAVAHIKDSTFYTYNASGHLIEERHYAHEKGMQYRYRFYYSGDTLISLVSGDDSYGYTEFYENGVVVRSVQTIGDGGPVETTYTHVFDTHGNWTRKTAFTRGVEWVEERSIHYY